MTPRRLLAYAWAAPWTVLGLLAGAVALLCGARVRRVGGTLEIAGGVLGRAVHRLPAPFDVAAMTLGHVVLGTSPATLDHWRAHERVHVAQYERWGPLFVPLYALASVWPLVRGRGAWAGNPFEREARALSAPPDEGGRG